MTLTSSYGNCLIVVTFVCGKFCQIVSGFTLYGTSVLSLYCNEFNICCFNIYFYEIEGIGKNNTRTMLHCVHLNVF